MKTKMFFLIIANAGLMIGVMILLPLLLPEAKGSELAAITSGLTFFTFFTTYLLILPKNK